jgi:hypothetical protein
MQGIIGCPFLQTNSPPVLEKDFTASEEPDRKMYPSHFNYLGRRCCGSLSLGKSAVIEMLQHVSARRISETAGLPRLEL